MGHFGSIVLYPTKPVSADSPDTRRRLALSILSTLVEAGILQPQALGVLEHDPEFTFATASIYEGQDEADEDVWFHASVERHHLQSQVSSLVYAATVAEWFGADVENPDELGGLAAVAVPQLDVCIFPETVGLWDAVADEMACESNVFLEFSYDDARLSAEMHRVRDEHHPIFSQLEQVLGSSISWTVVSG